MTCKYIYIYKYVVSGVKKVKLYVTIYIQYIYTYVIYIYVSYKKFNIRYKINRRYITWQRVYIYICLYTYYDILWLLSSPFTFHDGASYFHGFKCARSATFSSARPTRTESRITDVCHGLNPYCGRGKMRKDQNKNASAFGCVCFVFTFFGVV